MARYGGEEFALVLEGTDRAGARQLAERIREEVAAQTFESAKGPFKATLSLGVAVYPDDGKAKQDIISCADKALYAAKHAGRNRTVCHGEIARAKRRAIAGARGSGVGETCGLPARSSPVIQSRHSARSEQWGNEHGSDRGRGRCDAGVSCCRNFRLRAVSTIRLSSSRVPGAWNGRHPLRTRLACARGHHCRQCHRIFPGGPMGFAKSRG